MLETWILLGLCLGLAIALIEINALWRRRMTRYRHHWKSDAEAELNTMKLLAVQREQHWAQRYGYRRRWRIMPEYIEREAAIKALCEVSRLDDEILLYTKQIDAIRFIPAADVRPVVMARWKRDGEHNILRCSNCNTPSMNIQNFCPVCGALMLAVEGTAPTRRTTT